MKTQQEGANDNNTVIYFVRHADVHNPQDVLYGRLPRFGLSQLGWTQAQVTASVLAETSVSAFYSSPQLRARQTAEVIRAAHPGVPLHISKLLAEVLTGWQGRLHVQLEEIGFNFYDNPVNLGDENLADVWKRINRFVARTRRLNRGTAVVAVTHGDICHLARGGFRGLPIDISSIRLPHPYPGKGSLTRLTFSADLSATYPISVEYFDPNGHDARWSGSYDHRLASGWVQMELVGAAKRT